MSSVLGVFPRFPQPVCGDSSVKPDFADWENMIILKTHANDVSNVHSRGTFVEITLLFRNSTQPNVVGRTDQLSFVLTPLTLKFKLTLALSKSVISFWK